MAGVEAWFSNSSWSVHSAFACRAIGESMSCRSSCPILSVAKLAGRPLEESSRCALSRLRKVSGGVGEVKIAFSDV